MSTTVRKKEANRKNGERGGVRTPAGKSISRFNARRHGLLSKEIVIKSEPFAENEKDFKTLCEHLEVEFQPEGAVEKMLLDNLAISHWRRLRVHRYEKAAVQLSHAKIDIEARPQFAEFEKRTEELTQRLREYDGMVSRLEKARGEAVIDWSKLNDLDWKLFLDYARKHLSREGKFDLDRVKTYQEAIVLLRDKHGYEDQSIFEGLFGLHQAVVENIHEQLKTLEAEKAEFSRLVEAQHLYAVLPGQEDVDRIVRYGAHISRQFARDVELLLKIQYVRREVKPASQNNALLESSVSPAEPQDTEGG